MVHVILKLKYTLSLFPFFLPLLPFKNRHVSIFLFSIYIYSFSSQRIEKESKQNRELDASRLPNICLPMRTIPPLLCVDEEKRNVSYSTTNTLSTVHTRIVSASLSRQTKFCKRFLFCTVTLLLLYGSRIAAVSTTVVQHRPTNSERLCARIREREEIYIYRVFPIFSSPFYVRFISGNKFFFLRLLANVSSSLVCEEIIDISYTFRGKFKNLFGRKF